MKSREADEVMRLVKGKVEGRAEYDLDRTGTGGGGFRNCNKAR